MCAEAKACVTLFPALGAGPLQEEEGEVLLGFPRGSAEVVV